MPSESEVIGASIAAARASFGTRVGTQGSRKKLSQQGLYRLCQAEEAKLHGSDQIAFPNCHERVADRKIRAFETGEVRPTSRHLRIFERALRLSEGDLDPPLLTVDDVATRPPQRQYAPNLRGLELMPRCDILTDETQRVMDSLDRALRVRPAAHGVKVACVMAPPGYGKSFTLAQWWYARASKASPEAVLALDCTKMPSDQIIREIGMYFCGIEFEILNDELVDAIRSAGVPLLILDGLSTEPPKGTNLPTTSDFETLRPLRELVELLARRGATCRILLGIQVPYATKAATVTMRFSTSAEVTTEEVCRLSAADGARMFTALNVKGVSEDDLRQLSTRLSGLPLAIEAVARLLVDAYHSGDFSKLERLVTQSGDEMFSDQLFDRFLAQVMNNIVLDGDPENHPEAFIRLLALFPGPVHRSVLEMLLDKGVVTRLKGARIERFAGDRMPFVNDANGLFSLHPLVKRHIEGELDAICRGKQNDAHTSVPEIQWIHATMAVYNLSRLKSDPLQLKNVDISFIEGALHHLVALRDLCPIAPPYLDDASFVALRRRIADHLGEASADIDAKAITRFCFRAIALPYFFERTFRLTRLLGHYETKARLLSFLERGDGRGASVDYLSSLEGSRIYTEIAVSWMHSGRLQLAHDAVAIGKRLIGVTSLKALSAAALMDRTRSDTRAEGWIQFATLSAIQASILIRQGRDLDRIEDNLAAAAEIAETILAVCDRSDVAELRSNYPVIRAAKNIVTRRAYARYLAGDLRGAEEAFGTAAYIEARLNRPFLSGEAGRRYVEVLIRSGGRNSLDAAREIVNSNLATDSTERSKAERASNDIISVMTLDAALDRVAGDLDLSDRKLARIAEHAFVRTGEAPYAARQELRLETFRLQIARGEEKNQLQDDLRALAIEFKNRHHLMFAYEAQLLLAETRPSDNEALLASLERDFRHLGWGLLETDVEFLRAGGSIVRDRGL